MEIAPTIVCKRLVETEPGELIRFSWGGPSMALVAMSDSTRTLAFLSGREVNGGPVFLVPKVDAKVVSYGTNFTVEIDQDPAFTDVHDHSYYDVPGSILITSAQGLLCVAPMKGTHVYGNLTYNFETGLMGAPASSQEGVRFGKWRIWLPVSPQLVDQPRSPIFALELSPAKV